VSDTWARGGLHRRAADCPIARVEETVGYFSSAHIDDDTTVNIAAYVLEANGAQSGNIVGSAMGTRGRIKE
jgi:hypothetical protein